MRASGTFGYTQARRDQPKSRGHKPSRTFAWSADSPIVQEVAGQLLGDGGGGGGPAGADDLLGDGRGIGDARRLVDHPAQRFLEASETRRQPRSSPPPCDA